MWGLGWGQGLGHGLSLVCGKDVIKMNREHTPYTLCASVCGLSVANMCHERHFIVRLYKERHPAYSNHRREGHCRPLRCRHCAVQPIPIDKDTYNKMHCNYLYGGYYYGEETEEGSPLMGECVLGDVGASVRRDLETLGHDPRGDGGRLM